MKGLFKSIYRGTKSPEEGGENSVTNRIKRIEMLDRSKKKIQMKHIFQRGFGSPGLSSLFKRTSTIFKRSSVSSPNTVTSQNPLHKLALNNSVSNTCENIDDTSDPAEIVSHKIDFTSKPSLLDKDRKKRSENNVEKKYRIQLTTDTKVEELLDFEKNESSTIYTGARKWSDIKKSNSDGNFDFEPGLLIPNNSPRFTLALKTPIGLWAETPVWSPDISNRSRFDSKLHNIKHSLLNSVAKESSDGQSKDGGLSTLNRGEFTSKLQKIDTAIMHDALKSIP